MRMTKRGLGFTIRGFKTETWKPEGEKGPCFPKNLRGGKKRDPGVLEA